MNEKDHRAILNEICEDSERRSMLVDPTMDAVEAFPRQLDTVGIDVLRELVKVVAERPVDGRGGRRDLRSSLREWSHDRLDRRNGYRERPVDTRVGTISLDIPKLRERSYFPG